MSDPVSHSLTVPGSVLLAGEYAVLEEGGLGLACAVEPHVRATWHPSNTLEIFARFEDQHIRWIPHGPEKVPLLDHLWDILSQRGGPPLSNLKFTLTLDSTALARQDGRKSGLGSSAAAAVAATAALWYLETGAIPSPEHIFQTALLAHQRAQKGRGSGYDVACSAFGGMGLFRGGKHPTWTPMPLNHCPAFKLMSAPNSVSTTHAIARWTQWKAVFPDDWARTLFQSQLIVSKLAQSQDQPSFQAFLAEAAEQGQAMGRDMGVWDSANHAFLTSQKQRGLCKALGAGNELLAQCCEKNDPERAPLTLEGIVWY